MKTRLVTLAALESIAIAGLCVACSEAANNTPSGPGQAGSANQGQAGSAPAGGNGNVGQSGAGIGGSSSGGGGSSAGGMAGTAGAATAGNGGTPSAGAGGAGDGGSGGTGGGGAPPMGMSSGCNKAPMIASDMYNNGKTIPITAAGMQRRYILSVPTNYDNKKPYKLVIAYHQLDGNDVQMYNDKYYHLQPLSNDTTIFVAPNGQKNGAPCSVTTSRDMGCGWPNPNGSDIALADEVVKQVKENFCIDTNRIFANGWSFGGSMSYATACERPLGTANGFIRAIAVYAGAQLSGNCSPATPVAYYGSHGTNDTVLCYDENSSNCAVGNGLKLAENYAKLNGCTYATPTKVTNGNHMCTSFMGCDDGYPAEFCSFAGPHTPDPEDQGQQTSWQYQKAWDFFAQF